MSFDFLELAFIVSAGCVSLLWLFLVIRCYAMLYVTNKMFRVAVEEHECCAWYTEWDPTDAIFNTAHWGRWTPKQWIKYQKEVME